MPIKLNGSGSGSVALNAPANTSGGSDISFTLPTADGTSGQVLQTNGSGALSFASASSDNITEGNTTAEVVDTGSDGHFKVTTEGTERARVDNSGRLLVGTSSTSKLRTIVAQGNSGSANDGGALQLSTGLATPADGNSLGYLFFTDSTHDIGASIVAQRDGGTWSASSKPTRLIFSTAANGASSTTERMRITSAGDVLLGKTSYSSSSGVGVFYSPSQQQFGQIIDINQNTYTLYNAAVSAYRFYVNQAGTINATSTSITAISDQSLKENIRDLETGLSEVMALKPRRFDWKEETQINEKNVAGFIAQEVEEVFPELVYDYAYNADETKKAVKMGDMLPTLVKAIQEQQVLITNLEAANAALEARLTALEGGAS